MYRSDDLRSPGRTRISEHAGGRTIRRCSSKPAERLERDAFHRSLGEVSVSKFQFQCEEDDTQMLDQHPNSEIPAHHSPFEHVLSHFSDRFNVAGPVKIVAIGSSSTAGEGGIAPYPCRLELALRDPGSWPEGADKFKHRMIDVINRGKGGDEDRKSVV